jgi:hypothetical protein
MDPVSIVVAAVVAGAAASLRSAASDAVTDAYETLKRLLQSRFGRKSKAHRALEVIGQDPGLWVEPLESEVAASGAAHDEAVLAAAQRVLAIADPDGTKQGKYSLVITGGKGIAIGDYGNVTMNFSDDE